MKFITVEEYITSNEILEEYRKYQFDDGKMTPDRKKIFEEKALVKGTLTDEEKELISHKNAEKLFKM